MAIDQLSISQSGKETLINELFDSLRPWFTLGKWGSGSVGLTLKFYGGRFNGVAVADQTLTLPASATSYIEANLTTGVVSQNTSGYGSGTLRLGIAVTSASGLTSYTPERDTSGGGGGGSYTLPIASASVLGGLKVGSGLAIDVSGILSTTSVGYTLPIATASVLGGVKQGAGVSIDGTGVISSSGYTLPIATASVLGGVKAGSGVSIDVAGVLSASGSYVLPVATASVLGGVKQGAGVAIDGAGVISAATYTLPIATASVLGGVKAGAGVSIDGTGVLSSTGTYTLPVATTTVLGGVKQGSGVSIDGAGVISSTGGYTLPVATVSVLGGVKAGAGLAVDGTGILTTTGTPVLLSDVNVWTKNQSTTPVVLTDAASIVVNASFSNNFRVTLGGARTLANPTNLTDGMVLNFKIKQDATGARTLAYGSKYKWPFGVVASLSTAPNAIDFMSAYYDSTDDILICNMIKSVA